MRIVIKDADFSAVSIGKIGEDLSFNFNSSNYNDWMVNPPVNPITQEDLASGVNAGSTKSGNGDATCYQGSNGDSSYTTYTGPGRFVSKDIPVVPGMKVTFTADNTTTIPVIVCLDSSKQAMTPVNTTNCAWAAVSQVFTIPAGCAFIQLSIAKIASWTSFVGTMPE
jgi:hypothetical protein